MEDALDPLYRDEILDHYDSSPYRGRLDHPDYACDMDNPLCGDKIHLELSITDDGRIEKVRFDGRGCIISQASASILAEHLEGISLEKARQITSADVMKILGMTLTPTRMKCGLLAWRALQQAVQEPAAGG